MRTQNWGIWTNESLAWIYLLLSGPNDNVFVFFSGHGDIGYLCVERGESRCDYQLRAPDLNSAIVNMHNSNKYKYMVFYIEACHSGSLFEVFSDRYIKLGRFSKIRKNWVEIFYLKVFDLLPRSFFLILFQCFFSLRDPSKAKSKYSKNEWM